ncbi:hypothetical protein KIN20_007790 [Parelaphostrongylus tenuis]|uniref:EGF domain-specific O-linked N-acetylglucosamine transferase n=1 Tax=Parelaphostrongylus tenuis TaxID=148309 RepID=A0AAD5MPJ7_PARTN|nr:hypothetical protein KIN20_007790 [Parelaphostrongylus tenuis]
MELYYAKIIDFDLVLHFQLLKALEDIPNITVKVVDYNERIPFLSQLDSTHNSDVFIGMHGAGLTHLLFLPDWAVVMELYNCDDQHCYKDLARLRGVKYVTWDSSKQHLIYPEGGEQRPGTEKPHKKFMNYRFNPMEFQQRVKVIIEFVRRHPKFVEARRQLRRTRKLEEL